MDVMTPKERRTLSRLPKNESIRLRFEMNEGGFSATVRDISLYGMGILTQHQFEPGTWLVVEPVEPRRHFSPELRAEVRHSTKSDQGGYRSDAALTEP